MINSLTSSLVSFDVELCLCFCFVLGPVKDVSVINHTSYSTSMSIKKVFTMYNNEYFKMINRKLVESNNVFNHNFKNVAQMLRLKNVWNKTAK